MRRPRRARAERGAAAGRRRGAKGSGPVGRHDRVEHERGDTVRVPGGIGKRDLRPVGDAVENEALVAAGDAHRLDVGDAVGRAIDAAAPPEPAAHAVATARGCAAIAGPAVQRARVACAALVEHQQVAGGDRGAEDPTQVCGERQRRLSRAAGQREDGRRGRVCGGRRDPLNGQRDGARHGPGAVERDVDPRALVARRRARGPQGIAAEASGVESPPVSSSAAPTTRSARGRGGRGGTGGASEHAARTERHPVPRA